LCQNAGRPQALQVRRIAILALERCMSLDLVGPLEVFASAREARSRGKERDAGYQCVVTGLTAAPVRAESGLTVIPEVPLARLGPLDTLIIAGGQGARAAARDPEVVKAVQRAARGARRVASVCTGAFLLAAAGLLDGKRATTHWAHCAALASGYPAVTVDPDPIFVRDGRVWTSAGVTAGIDLALAMVEEDLGRDLASLVARWLVVFVRRAGGQSQFSAQLSAQTATRTPLRELQSWIADHPEAALDVPSLARRAAMSVRHFSRVFRAETGLSPADYVERARVETARRLLETTSLSVEGVAGASGFRTAESLRRSLTRRVGLSPREYRARFGAPAR
jgi:transcriptional regulator GlxA family with amidase domain